MSCDLVFLAMANNNPHNTPPERLPEISTKGWSAYKKEALQDKAGTFLKAEKFIADIQVFYDDWDEDEPYCATDTWYQWNIDLGPIEVLEFLRKKGCLTPEEEQRFAEICTRFKAHKPQIETMQVYVPPFLRRK